jgi:Fe-S cluster biogenesis protein NfuA
MEEKELKEVEEILEKIRPALKEHHGDLKVRSEEHTSELQSKR